MTTSAISSGRAEAAERELALHEGGDAVGIGLLPPLPAAAREQDRAGRHAVDADAVAARSRAIALASADLGGLGDVVAGAAADLAAPDRGDEDDDAAAARAQLGEDGARDAERRPQVAIEDAAARSASSTSWKSRAPEPPTLLTRMSIAAEGGARAVDQRRHAGGRRHVGSHADRRRLAAAARPRLGAPLRRASAALRAHSTTRQPSPASASAMARPMPRLAPVTSATFPGSPRSMAGL